MTLTHGARRLPRVEVVVCLKLEDADDLSKADIGQFELWRHGDEKPSRDEAINSLVGMLKRLIKAAKKDKLELAPVIGIGCPGRIDANGSLEAGGQNLPGNWESSAFNLPVHLHEAIPEIGGSETTVFMHNDAVVQGLSEAPFMHRARQCALQQSKRLIQSQILIARSDSDEAIQESLDCFASLAMTQ